MKVLAADYAQYVPRERLVERFRYETGFASKKTQGGPFFLTEYKGGEGAKGAELRFLRSGEGIYSIFDTIVPIVGTVANAVSKGANYYKELLGGGIEPEALAEVLKVEDTKPTEKAVVGEESAATEGSERR